MRRAMVLSAAALLLVSVVGSVPAPAAGALYMDDYRDTRWDPDTIFRVDSTTRAVWTNAAGRWLTITVAPFPDLRVARTFDVHVLLDTDGDRRTVDYKIWMDITNRYGSCQLREAAGDTADGHLRRVEGSPDYLGDGFITCHVDLSLIHPSARIAWWLHAAMIPSAFCCPGKVWTDRAPDVGWYV